MNPGKKKKVFILIDWIWQQFPHSWNLTYLGCVDQLISQALGDGLDVPESSFSCSCAQQPDGLKQKRERERRWGTADFHSVRNPPRCDIVSESVIDWATRGYSQWINKEQFLYECSSTPGQWGVSRRDSSLAQHIQYGHKVQSSKVVILKN